MKRGNKYNAKRCVYKGMSFDSILERDRFIFLEAEQNAGRITDLQHHVPFRLEVNGYLVGTYEADFTYRFPPLVVAGDGRLLQKAIIFTRLEGVIEDAKGVLTDTFKLKRKIFEAQYGKRIHIVTRSNLTELPRG